MLAEKDACRRQRTIPVCRDCCAQQNTRYKFTEVVRKGTQMRTVAGHWSYQKDIHYVDVSLADMYARHVKNLHTIFWFSVRVFTSTVLLTMCNQNFIYIKCYFVTLPVFVIHLIMGHIILISHRLMFSTHYHFVCNIYVVNIVIHAHHYAMHKRYFKNAISRASCNRLISLLSTAHHVLYKIHMQQVLLHV